MMSPDLMDTMSLLQSDLSQLHIFIDDVQKKIDETKVPMTRAGTKSMPLNYTQFNDIYTVKTYSVILRPVARLDFRVVRNSRKWTFWT